MSQITPPKQRAISIRQKVAIGIGLLVSVFFLYLAFRELQPSAFFNSLGEVNLLWLIVATLLFGVALVVITLRWQFLLRAVQLVPLWPLTQLVTIGYMGNNVYPLRAGEVLRIYLLRRNHNVPIAAATTTAVVERVFDGLVMLSFILLGLLASGIASPEIEMVVSLATPIFLVATVIFFGLAAQPNLLRRLVGLIARLLPESLANIVASLGEGIIAGLEGLRSPLYLAGTIITSFGTWGIQGIVYWIVMWAFGLNVGLGVALLVVGVVNLAGLIPASPGQVGVYEFFGSTVMMAAGVPQETALAYTVVVHIVIWLPATVVGFFFLARMGLGMNAVEQARSETPIQPIMDHGAD